MKRGVGRGAGANGNGRVTLPPSAAPSITRYQQPPAPARTGLGLFRKILVGTLILFSALALGIAGGSYLYFHQTVADVQAHSTGVLKAQKALDIPAANQPAIALVIGYDHRAGQESTNPSLSDTIMLVRADPQTKTISLLSFPRDLDVPIYCGPTSVTVDRINSAYGRCGEKGTLLTVKHLTGLPVNYLITVNFHGFKQVVDKLGGVWMDVDRRYYNKNTGAYYNNFANINLQAGYQKLTGQQALDFVRFRHTDSDLYRNARQQQFVRAFREQVSTSFSPFKVPTLVNAITDNIEVAEGGRKLQGKQVYGYALFAYGLPSGHLFQERISGVDCQIGCTASTDAIEQAVQQFSAPDVESSKAANAAALGRKLKEKAPPPAQVSVTVLNGNGVDGAAANASYLLAQRGYKTLTPPGQRSADAPKQVFHTKIYYDPAQKRSLAAAKALQNIMQPADIAKLPRDPMLLALDPGAMLLVVVGQTFHGTIAELPHKTVPVHQKANVRADASYGAQLLKPLDPKIRFPLMNPTVIERSSYPDTLPGDKPSRQYWIDRRGGHKAVRLVFRTGANEFWGIQETDWDGAPALADKSFRHNLGGREFDLYYNGSHLHMVVLRSGKASYWVVNTLLDSLSNETMLAIAKGLKPLTASR